MRVLALGRAGVSCEERGSRQWGHEVGLGGCSWVLGPREQRYVWGPCKVYSARVGGGECSGGGGIWTGMA